MYESLLYDSFIFTVLNGNNINPVKQMLFHFYYNAGKNMFFVVFVVCARHFFLWPKIKCKIRNCPKELVTFDWKNIFFAQLHFGRMCCTTPTNWS